MCNQASLTESCSSTESGDDLQRSLELINKLARPGCDESLNELFHRLIMRFANDAGALTSLAVAMDKIHRYADALIFAMKGLSIDPQNHMLNYHAARALWMNGAASECLKYVEEAARIWPPDEKLSVRYFLTCVQLALGIYEEGWKEYPALYSSTSLGQYLVRPDFPEWKGEPLSGCQFLYVMHDGFGDQIQFLRFAEWLHRQGATVDVLVNPMVAELAASVSGVRAVYKYPNVPNGPYTYWSYMMTLPAWMDLSVSMLPLKIPYVVTTPERRGRWRDNIESISPRSARPRSRRVGIVWSGSPSTDTDYLRSMSLETLRPLFECPSVTWFSVQKGARERESDALAAEFDIHTLGPSIEDFSDTLAILESLDLLITVDTSVAHLAGAAGRPVWVLQAAYSEWRWLEGRNDSPWYPSMRLFRQRQLGDWRPVIDEVREALRIWSATTSDESLVTKTVSLEIEIERITALSVSEDTTSLRDAVSGFRARYTDNAYALEQLALRLYRIDRFSDAVEVARQGLEIAPTRPLLHHYAALALSVCGNHAECLKHGREAARLLPDNPGLQYHLACYEIASGLFKEGWTRHKAYYTMPGPKDILIPVGIREWKGEPLVDRQILLVFDQGDGDKIQCIRFADYLHRQGATVDFLTTPAVAPVVASMKCIRAVYCDTEPAGQYDYWTHTMKVPEHIGLSASMLPAIDFPYMTAQVDRARHWRTQLDKVMSADMRESNSRVGIVWAGNPNHVWDRYRSIPLDMLRPLLEIPGPSWFSVQKGARERESEALAAEFDVHTLGPSIEDFGDTLAILESLDLLITVDTSVAHLAGAAGRPVWVLVPAYVEWRWLAGRSDSPWYPSMRLFRQRELGNWQPVIDEVRDALREWCEGRMTCSDSAVAAANPAAPKTT
jgi:ADP-heptose:LPS heptosyltransferase